MLFRQLFDSSLAQYTYLVGCQQTGEALVVDPERDIDRVLEAVAAEGMRVAAVAETHIHADFLSGARDLAEATGGTVYLSDEGDPDWTYGWADDTSAEVVLLKDGARFTVGNIEIQAVHTPGHTPEHLSFLVTDYGGGADTPMGLLSGDFVFVGDVGRPDLLESAAGEQGAQDPAARVLFRSLKEDFLPLGDALQVWPAHGAGSACGKALGAVPQSTVGYERRMNAALEAVGRGEEAFVDFILAGQPEPPLYFGRMKRQNRDGVPRLQGLPLPAPLGAEGLDESLKRLGATVLDTRPDRRAFMAAHLPGALYAPLGGQFVTTAGSYVTDPNTPLVLLVDEAHAEDAVRRLVRIGLDRVVATITPEAFAGYAEAGGETASLKAVSFEDVAQHRADDGVEVVDVRREEEYVSGHVPGAVHAPHVRLAEKEGDLPDGKTLYVHCKSGARAAVASAFLAARGHDVVYVDDAFARFRDLGDVETGAATEGAE